MAAKLGRSGARHFDARLDSTSDTNPTANVQGAAGEAARRPGEGNRAFFVRGIPIPQGSMRAYVRGERTNKRTGKRSPAVHVTTDNARLHGWRESVALAARSHGWGRGELWDGPCAVALTFVVRRPESHWRKDGTLGRTATLLPHASLGDSDKLERAILDALTGTVWANDRRVVVGHHARLWGPGDGVLIQLARFDGAAAGSLDFDAPGMTLERLRAVWPG